MRVCLLSRGDLLYGGFIPSRFLLRFLPVGHSWPGLAPPPSASPLASAIHRLFSSASAQFSSRRPASSPASPFSPFPSARPSPSPPSKVCGDTQDRGP